MTVTGEVFSIEIRRRGNYKVGGSMYRYSEVYPKNKKNDVNKAGEMKICQIREYSVSKKKNGRL